jgi:hypothetical protein
LLLALEAVGVKRNVDGGVTLEAEQALRDSLAESGGISARCWRGFTEAHFCGANRIAAYGAAGDVKLWSLDRLEQPPLLLSSDSERIDHVVANLRRRMGLSSPDSHRRFFLRAYCHGGASAETHRARGTSRSHPCVVVSPDDRWLAVRSDAPDVQLWRVGEFERTQRRA